MRDDKFCQMRICHRTTNLEGEGGKSGKSSLSTELLNESLRGEQLTGDEKAVTKESLRSEVLSPRDKASSTGRRMAELSVGGLLTR